MNPAAPTIAYGHRRGQPRPVTDIALDGLTAAREVAIRLKRNGFTVIGAVVGDAVPTVQVAAGPATTEMIDLDIAAYYKHRYVDGIGYERHGQFPAETTDGHKVRVVWVERGH